MKIIGATHLDSNPFSPLYPDHGFKPGQRWYDVNLVCQILDPAVPAKVEKPTKDEEFGTTAAKAFGLRTGLGDGEYSVTAEIVDLGEPFGERVAAIHIQFLATEDIKAQRSARGTRQRSNSSNNRM